MFEEYKLYNGEITITFDPAKHVYRANGIVVNGVTTILGVLDKPFLTSWASKEAVKELGYYERQIWTPNGYIDVPQEEQAEGLGRLNATLEHFKIMTADEYWHTLHQAKNAHTRRKQEAASIGTMTHKWIEDYIKGFNPEMPTIPKVKNGVEAFLKWLNGNKVEFKLSEAKVYSKKFKIAGTLDWTAIVNGISTLGDIKTSNFFDQKFFWQTSAYQYARQEEYPDEAYGQQVIIRCDKNDGTVEVFTSTEYRKNIKAFAACITIFNRQKQTKKDDRTNSN